MNNKENPVSLTPTEWRLMECLWERAPKTGREAVEHMASSAGWSRSTTLTLLRRMTDKGLICCDETGEVLTYSPLVERELAVLRETDDFLNRVYKGSVSMLLNTITKKQELSKDEIEELYGILRRAENGE